MRKPVEIRKVRKRFGITQDKFAKLLGLTQSAISQMQVGDLQPSGSTRAMVGLLAKVPKSRIQKRANWMPLISAGGSIEALLWLLLGKTKRKRRSQ